MIINQMFVTLWGGKFKDINSSINIHYGKDVNLLIRTRDIVRILYTRLVYHFESREYYYYHLYEKSRSEILKFYPKKYQADLYYRVNPKEARDLATDKYASFLRFKEYYKRDTCAYNPTNATDSCTEFCDFIAKHPRFIIKPLCANSGSGVTILTVKDYEDSKGMFQKLKNDYSEGFIVEELIHQVSEIGQFHPQSVNTVRINTMQINGQYLVKFPSMRIGRGSAIVDNANAGGITAGLDATNGKIIAVGDETGKKYIEHPDTKIKFEGYVVPKWNELCELAITIAKDFSECKIIGFDFALTDKGWVLVEVNAYPLLIFQMATQIGIREEMEKITKLMQNE